MNILSLFSGIGGLELGLERAGMTTIGQVEIDPFCQAILKKHWPTVPKHDDVRTAAEWWSSEPRPRVDLICGGYPCQPFSTAGNMRSDADARYLWPAFADLLRTLRPRYALLENVPAHLRVGLDRVLADLARLGFNAEWSIVHAAAMGAPHRRPRLFVLAYPHEPEPIWGSGLPIFTSRRGHNSETTNTHRCRTHSGRAADAIAWAREPGMGRMADGLPDGLDRDRLHALGNAVVPQVSEFIGHRIMSLEVA